MNWGACRPHGTRALKRGWRAAAEDEGKSECVGYRDFEDDANTLQREKERRKEGERREGGMVGSAAYFGFTISEKNTLPREKR